MKIPQTPPDFETLFRKCTQSPEDFFKITEASASHPASGKYLHWDKLRFFDDPPSGLTLKEWWFAIKWPRKSILKDVPLWDKMGANFKYCEADPIPERLHKITLEGGGHIQMPDNFTNIETKDRYLIRSLIEEGITSSQLEGAATTRKDAKEMIRQDRAPRDRSERMILNNFMTMKEIRRFKDEPLSKDLVFEIHKLITDDTLEDPTGVARFRRSDENIRVVDPVYAKVFHEPPPAEELEKRMVAMCDFANEKTPGSFIHPAIRAIILHFWLAYDHPFVDGNGRTARALFYWAMLHYGYWLFEFISISQIILKGPSNYNRAFLYTETDENDLTYFILYHLHVIRRAMRELHKYIGRKSKQTRALTARLRNVTFLNHRQRDLVGHALRHPHQLYTIRSHQTSHNLAYQTARTDLQNLSERGLLDAGKRGRTWYFTPTSNLEEKLGTLE